jgi:PAS domain-containing protein
LCESEHIYHTLFERIGDAAFLVKARGGKIIDANHQTGMLLHWFRSEILGRKESQFMILNPCPTQESDAPGETAECKLVRVDGTAIPIGVRITRLTLPSDPMLLRLCHEFNPASTR